MLSKFNMPATVNRNNVYKEKMHTQFKTTTTVFENGTVHQHIYLTTAGYAEQVGYYDDNNEFVLHNDHGPAHIRYTSIIDNKTEQRRFYIQSATYYFKNKAHREDGPAITNYNSEGLVTREIHMEHARVHNTYGPAIHNYRKGELESQLHYVNDVCLLAEEVEAFMHRWDLKSLNELRTNKAAETAFLLELA